jgi:hypothetical protein
LPGRPVLVGNGTTHDVVTSGSGLVAFLGVGTGVASVAMSNAVAVRPAVAHRIRSPLLVGVIATPPPLPPPPLDLAASWLWRVLTWLVRVEFEVAREELQVMSCLRMAFSLVAVLARLSRAMCVCVFWASGSRGSLVITRYQSLPLTPGKVLPVCVTQ